MKLRDVVMRDRRRPLCLIASRNEGGGFNRRHYGFAVLLPPSRSGHLPRPTQNPCAVQILFLVEERCPERPPRSPRLPGSRTIGTACSHEGFSRMTQPNLEPEWLRMTGSILTPEPSKNHGACSFQYRKHRSFLTWARQHWENDQKLPFLQNAIPKAQVHAIGGHSAGPGWFDKLPSSQNSELPCLGPGCPTPC